MLKPSCLAAEDFSRTSVERPICNTFGRAHEAFRGTRPRTIGEGLMNNGNLRYGNLLLMVALRAWVLSLQGVFYHGSVI